MFTKTYTSAIEFLVENAPYIEGRGTNFIQWVDVNVDLLVFIYGRDYDQVTEDLVEACKEEQGYKSTD